MEHVLDSVVDVTVENMQEVVETSNDRLVVMSFYSEKMPDSTAMNAALVQVSQRYQEHMVIAQVNCDLQPQMAQYFQIQAVPTVMLLQDGSMVDGFSGKKTEAELESLIEKYLPEMWQLKWQQARQLLAVDKKSQALPLLREALQMQPQVEIAQDLMVALIALKHLDEAQALLSQWGDQCDTAVRVDLENQLAQAVLAMETPKMQACKKAFERTPQDPKVVLDYAVVLHESGRQEQAFKLLLTTLSKDLNALEGDVKHTFMTLLASHEQDDILVKTFRRQFYGLLH